MKLTIGKQVNRENPKNVYQLHMILIHGDDEIATEELRNFGETDPNLIPCIEMLQAFQSTDFSARENPTMFLECIYQDDEEKADEFYDYLYDLIGVDALMDDCGCLAALDNLTITYFDENGVEYKVEMEEDE